MKIRLVCPNCDFALACIDGLNDVQSKPDWRLTPIGKMNLSVRTETALINGGFKTAGHIANASNSQLLMTINFGRKGLAEVREALAFMEKEETS